MLFACDSTIEAAAVLSAPFENGVLGRTTRIDLEGHVGFARSLGEGRYLAALTRELVIVDGNGSITRSGVLLPRGSPLRRWGRGSTRAPRHWKPLPGRSPTGAELADSARIRCHADRAR